MSATPPESAVSAAGAVAVPSIDADRRILDLNAPARSVGGGARRTILPYAGTIFLSAFLLFLVQPIIAKQILPWFGGSASVWTTCLVFFQGSLLAGYAYADLTHRLGTRRQTIVHIVLLVASLASLPIIASETWKPQGAEQPIVRILLLLSATIGLPYFLLATTTPLLQAWYVRRFHAAVPYRLFALSNFASLLALLGFPTLLEPWLSLPQLGWGWTALYAIFVAVCVGTGVLTLRRTSDADERVADADGNVNQAAPKAPTALTQLLWLALSAMGSVMLLAVTNHVTQNISSVPFLWLLPLSLYLLSFILCFDHPRWYVRPLFMSVLLVLLPLMAWKVPSLDLYLAAPLYFAGLFVACMFCHGELARLKPDPRYLTRFYLMLSLGGALGAALLAIGAPLVLSGYFELNLTLVALGLLLLARAIDIGVAPRSAQGRMRLAAAAAVVIVLAVWAVRRFANGAEPPALLELAMAVVVLLAVLLAQVRGVERIAVALILVPTVVLSWRGAEDYRRDVRVMERDFYGVVRTRDREMEGVSYRALFHGSIMHGGQLQGVPHRNMASDYFGPTSGYGRLFAALNDIAPGPREIGVIGLGAGVIAAYGRAGDHITFYEISARVVDIERREFTFLGDTPAKVSLVLGDGRLSLEREAEQGRSKRFRVLGIDAFAGDSIPMHLITREAMALYARQITDDGVIVFQATNRYVNLMPVVKRLADEVGLTAVLVSDAPRSASGIDYWLSSTDQVLVTRNKALLENPKLRAIAEPIADRTDLPTFTDAHHNLFRILK